ncbi:unnamed protein product [Bursaphelenchus xylophilus]|uniref:(pine wood nematode) hypothetical protein n=1 Tax=Bursaphelenchus xylophilus TaxID=6326 RepID=A0A1I7RMM8_BURXY|nr:unnamed protein product [Bursaphelenchus xylophilus]CAG9125659.1 unnamed protein product [Bursaphelenchus xylophilus]
MKSFWSISASFLLFQAVHAVLVYEKQIDEFTKLILTQNDKCKDQSQLHDGMLDFVDIDIAKSRLFFTEGNHCVQHNFSDFDPPQLRISRTIEFYTSRTIYTVAWKNDDTFTYLSNLGGGKITVPTNPELRHALIHRNALFLNDSRALYLGEELGDVNCVDSATGQLARECDLDMILPQGEEKTRNCLKDGPCYLLDDFFVVRNPDGFNIVYMSMDFQNKTSLDIVVLYHNGHFYVTSKLYECHKVTVNLMGVMQIPLKFEDKMDQGEKLVFEKVHETLNMFDRIGDAFLGVYNQIGLVNKYGHVRWQFFIFFVVEVMMLCGLVLLCLALNTSTDAWKLLAFPFVMGYRGLVNFIHARKVSASAALRTEAFTNEQTEDK